MDSASQEAAQQGPLADAEARQAVVEMATRVAQLVSNGVQGVTSALAEIIQQAGALTSIARESLLPAMNLSTNGHQNGEVELPK